MSPVEPGPSVGRGSLLELADQMEQPLPIATLMPSSTADSSTSPVSPAGSHTRAATNAPAASSGRAERPARTLRRQSVNGCGRTP